MDISWDEQSAFGGDAALVAPVCLPGVVAFLGGQVSACDDGTGEAQGLDEQSGTLHGLGGAAQGGRHGGVRCGDASAGSPVSCAGVCGGDVEDGVGADLRVAAQLLAGRLAQGRCERFDPVLGT